MGVYDFDENNLPGLDDATFRKILDEPAAPYVPPPPPPPEESGYLGGTLKSLVRGIAEIPIAAGNALEWNEEAGRTEDDSKWSFINRTGQVVSDTAERVRDFIPPAESGDSRVKQSIFGGVESLPLSLAYAIPSTVGAVAAGAAATPETFGAATIPAALAGAAGGQALSSGIMFRSTAQQTLEQLKKQLPDADPNALIDAAKKAGHKEWQGEAISDIPEALIFSRIPGLKAGADTVKALLKPGVKQFAKNVALSMPGEQVGEGYTSYGQAQAMNEVLPENLRQKPWEAVKDTVGPTAVMTLLMAGLGTGVQRYRANGIVNVLENANADPVERGKAAGTVYGLIKEANGEEAARNFLQHAYQAIGDEATTGTQPYAMNLSDPALMQPPKLPSDIAEEGPLPDEQVFPNLPTPTPAFNPPAPSGPISRALSTTPEVVTPEVLNQPALPNVRQWIPPDVIDAEFTDLNAPRIEGRKQIPWEGGGEQSRIPYQTKGATSDLPQMQEQNPANPAQMPDLRDEEVTREENPNDPDSVFSGVMAADYLLTGGFDVMLSTEYLLQAYSGLFQKSSAAVERIRKKYAQEIRDKGLQDIKSFINSELHNRIMSEIKSTVSSAYNNNSAIDDIFNDLAKYPTGMSPKVGNRISQKIDALEESDQTNNAQVQEVREQEAAPYQSRAATRPKGLREVIEARQREREGVIPDGQEEMRGQGEGGQVSVSDTPHYRVVPQDTPLEETPDHWTTNSLDDAKAIQARMQESDGIPRKIVEVDPQAVAQHGGTLQGKSPYGTGADWVKTDTEVPPSAIVGVVGQGGRSTKDKVMTRIEAILPETSPSGHPQTKGHLAQVMAEEGFNVTPDEVEALARSIRQQGQPTTDAERALTRILADDTRSNRHTYKPGGKVDSQQREAEAEKAEVGKSGKGGSPAPSGAPRPNADAARFAETRRKNLEKRLAIAKNTRERESIRAKLEKLKKESHKNIEEIVAANDAADLIREEKKQVERAKKVGEWRSKYMDRIEMTAAGDIVRHDHEKLNELVESNKISVGRAHQMIDDAVASGVVDSKVGEYMKSRVKVEEKAEPAPQHQAKKSPEPQNAIFTEDAYQKARARMKAKLSQLNAGFDPELLQDGITIAGYHLERGARKFADYTKAMVDEFGDAIRPYLKAFYNGVRDLPGIEWTSEMDDYEAVQKVSVEKEDAQQNRELTPAESTKIPVIDRGKGKPNTVYRDMYGLYDGAHLGLIEEPYDGTLEGLMGAYEKIQNRFNDFNNASNMESPIAATDESGKAKYRLSPNGRFIYDLQNGDEINTDAFKDKKLGASSSNGKPAQKSPERELYDRATEAHAHVSMNPAAAAKVWRDGMVSAAEELRESLEKIAKSDRQKEVIAAQINLFKQGYVEHARPILSAISRQVSSMVAGKSQFSKNHDKRNSGAQSAEQKANIAFTKWQKEAKEYARQAILNARTPEEVEADEQAAANETKRVATAKHNKELSIVKQWMALKPGDMVDVGGNGKVAIAKKNRKSIETEGGAKWTITELLGIESKKADELMAEVEAEIVSDTPYTLASHDSLFKRLRDGEPASVDEVKKGFDSLIEGEEAIKAELQAMKKDDLLKRMGRFVAGRYKNEKKDVIVSAIYRGMVTDFAYLDGSNSLSYGMRDKVSDVVRKRVEKLTEEDLKKYAEAIAKERDDYKARMEGYVKAIKNPETWEEFQKYRELGYKIEDLPPEKLKLYDELKAERNREQKAREAEKKATVSQVKTDVEMTLKETTHTKKGTPLFVVQLSDRVERDVYNELNAAAKKLGGYYSSFRGAGAVPGFQFKTREDAEKFMAIREGDVSRADKLEEKAEERQEKKVSKLRAVAESLKEKAEEQLSRDRLTNTARRARQANGAEESARSDIQLAETMLNLADAIESGEATHLDGVAAKTHVETLKGLLRSAKYAYEKAKDIPYIDSKNRTVTEDDVDFAKYPYPAQHESHIRTLATFLKDKKGAAMDAAWLSKMAKERTHDSIVSFIQPGDIERLESILAKTKRFVKDSSAKSAIENIVDRMQDYNRLQRMGIPDLPSLRAALREFLKFKAGRREADKAKQLERDLVGKKVGVDFFPTPPELAGRMVEIAGVEPGMRVLEPSAGNGNIAEAIRDAGAEPDVAEISPSLRKVLEAKGFSVVGQDFMDVDGEYDAIIMNPPFSNNQDIEHVRHAFDLLKPGGKLVAIMGEGAFFRGGKTENAFREWIDEQGAEVEKLPEGTFTDKRLLNTTGVNARLVVVRKEGAAEKPETSDNKIITALQEIVSRIGTITKTSEAQQLDDDISKISDEIKRFNSTLAYRLMKKGEEGAYAATKLNTAEKITEYSHVVEKQRVADLRTAIDDAIKLLEKEDVENERIRKEWGEKGEPAYPPVKNMRIDELKKELNELTTEILSEKDKLARAKQHGGPADNIKKQLDKWIVRQNELNDEIDRREAERSEVPAWHTSLPGQGFPVEDSDKNKYGTGDYSPLINKVLDDAINAITQVQWTNGEPLYARILPAKGEYNGRLRLVPRDQQTPGWEPLSGEAFRIDAITRDQLREKLRDLLRRAPILGEKVEAKTEKPPAEPIKFTRATPKLGSQERNDLEREKRNLQDQISKVNKELDDLAKSRRRSKRREEIDEILNKQAAQKERLAELTKRLKPLEETDSKARFEDIAESARDEVARQAAIILSRGENPTEYLTKSLGELVKPFVEATDLPEIEGWTAQVVKSKATYYQTPFALGSPAVDMKTEMGQTVATFVKDAVSTLGNLNGEAAQYRKRAEEVVKDSKTITPETIRELTALYHEIEQEQAKDKAEQDAKIHEVYDREPVEYIIAAMKPLLSKEDIKTTEDVIKAFKDGLLSYETGRGSTTTYDELPDKEKADATLAGLLDKNAKVSVLKDRVTLTVKGDPLTAEQKKENKEKAERLTEQAEQYRKESDSLEENGYTDEQLEAYEIKDAAEAKKRLDYQVMNLRSTADRNMAEAEDLLTAKNKDAKHTFWFNVNPLEQGAKAGGTALFWNYGNDVEQYRNARDAMKKLSSLDKTFAENPVLTVVNKGTMENPDFKIEYHNGTFHLSLNPIAFALEHHNKTTPLSTVLSSGMEPYLKDGDTIRLSPGYIQNRSEEVFLVPAETMNSEKGKVFFSYRITPATKGTEKTAIEKAIAPLLKKWKNAPEVKVVQSESELPENLKAEMASVGAQGEIDGVFNEGVVYLIADNMPNARDAVRVLLHEAVGHYGVRGLLGKRFDTVLLDVFHVYGKDGLQDIADRYGLDLNEFEDRMIACEEKLAELAESGEKPGLVKRAIAAIREWLRSIGVNVFLTDNDIRSMIAKAAEWVERGEGVPRFNGSRFMVAAWHGSPHDFDRFSTEKIGIGEGAQAYGYGLYFAGKKEVAEWYRDRLSSNGIDVSFRGTTPPNKPMGEWTADEWIARAGLAAHAAGGPLTLGYIRRQLESFAQNWRAYKETQDTILHALSIIETATLDDFVVTDRKGGRLYKVTLAPEEDELLLWDKPLSEQSERVRAALNDVVEFWLDHTSAAEDGRENLMSTMTGRYLYKYDALWKAVDEAGAMAFDGDKSVSEYLHSLGIRGIKYLDGTSRSAGEGDYNYVIFSDEDVDIKARFHIRQSFSTAAALNHLRTIDPKAALGGLKDFINPLDWSRYAKGVSEMTPQAVQEAVGYFFANPVFQAERDPDKQPFVRSGLEREQNKVDLLLKMFGWDGSKEKAPKLMERLTRTFTRWQNDDITTSWGRIMDSFQKLSAKDRKGVDWLLYRGDADGVSYKTYDMVKDSAKVAKRLPSEAAFNTYRQIRDHIDTVVAQVIEDQTRKFMFEAGLPEEEIEKHITDYRNQLNRMPGWMPRSHGEGDWQVNVYHHITRLKWQVSGGRAFLPFFPSQAVADEIEKLATAHGLKYRHLRNGRQSVEVDEKAREKLKKEIRKLKESLEKGAGEMYASTREEIEAKIANAERKLVLAQSPPSEQIRRFTNASTGIIGDVSTKNALAKKELEAQLEQAREDGESAAEIKRLENEIEKIGDGRIKVKVYMRLQRTERQAGKHVEEVQANLKKHMPENFLGDEYYEVSSKFSDTISEGMYGDMKNDFAMEQAQLKAIEWAANHGEISKEKAASLRHGILQTTAEVLMARGAGSHRIRRASYLIEGYDAENVTDQYHDYMTGTAGMLSKAMYAKEQFENFRYADPKVKRWAERYIKDNLRNMGLADSVSGNLRSLAAFMYLGFKVSSMLINATQVYALGIAELGRHTKRSALKLITAAQKDIVADSLTAEERELFHSSIWKIQEQETAVNEMSGSREGITGKVSRFMHILTDKALMPFQEVEMLNRKTMILSAYRAFRADGMRKQDAIDKALEVNRAVNFEMSRANLPGFARNPVGRTIYALQSFAWNNWNWVYNRLTSGEKRDMVALLKYAGTLAVIGGAAALPGGDELDKLLRRLTGRSIKMDLQKWTREHAHRYGTAGDMLNDFVWHGTGSAVGVNISNALRLQVPFVSPWLQGETLPESSMGVFAGLWQKGANAGRAFSKGDAYRGAESLAPEFVSGPMRAYRQYAEGATTMGGKPVFDENGKPIRYSLSDVALRTAGFQPLKQSERTEAAQQGKILSQHWNEERQDLIDAYRIADKDGRRGVMQKIMRFNAGLRESQAAGLVLPIKLSTLQRAVQPKPDRKKAGWLRKTIG